MDTEKILRDTIELLHEQIKVLKSENKDYKEECERLHQVAEFWQQKYNETAVGWKPPKIDNNPMA